MKDGREMGPEKREGERRVWGRVREGRKRRRRKRRKRRRKRENRFFKS